MLKIQNIFVFFTVTFLLFGCGEESHYSTETTSPSTPEITKETFNGIVVDGYIKNSKVCFDRDMDGVCSVDEQTTTTDENGLFQLYKEDLNATLVELIATEGEDTSTARDFSGIFRTILESDKLEANSTVVISPITDLVAQSFFNSTNKNFDDLSDAKNLLSEMLDLTSEQLEEDPMRNIDIFALSQEIQHTKLLLEEVTKKNVVQIDALELESEIKTQIIEFDFDIEKILIALEIRLDFTIPTNEREFVIGQAKELKNQLNSLSKDTSLSIENLNRLQKALDIKQNEAYTLIRFADENMSLSVIDLNITGESITQTLFNTTNAELDDNACVSQYDYHQLKSNAFVPEIVEDSKNGIGIKSSYGMGENLEDSEVILFYPSLSQKLSNDVTVVFQESGEYYFTFDKSWADNAEKTVYIRTPKDTQGLYSCYRYLLSSVHSSEIEAVKVFSYSELN